MKKFLKKAMSLVLTFAMVCTMVTVPALAETTDETIRVELEVVDAKEAYVPNDVITVNVMLESCKESGSTLMAGVTVTVGYDKNVLRPDVDEYVDEWGEGETVNWQNPGYYKDYGWSYAFGNPEPGVIKITGGGTANRNADLKQVGTDGNRRIFATLKFDVLTDAESCVTALTINSEDYSVGTYASPSSKNADSVTTVGFENTSAVIDGVTPVIDTVTLSGETVQVEGGESAAQTLQATAKSLKGTDITSSVAWTVSPADSGVTVNENGLVTIANNAKAAEYTVTASAKEDVSAGEDVSDTFTVTRAASVPVRMRLVGADRTIRAQKAGEDASGETACSISAKIYDQYGEEATFDGATFVLTLDDNDLGLDQNIASNVYARPTTKAGTVGYTFTFNWDEYTLSERGTITVTKEEPALASVTVEDISATIPVSGTTTKQFIAVAKDQYGADIATAQSWNLSDSPVDAVPGAVSIDIATGEVTITSDAVPGEYEVQVTAVANGDSTNPVDGFATLTLSTINADWSGVTAVTGAEYGVTNEELVNLPATGELDYTLEAGSSTYDKTLTGVYSVVDGTAVPNAGTFNVEVSFKVLDDAANGEFAGEELFFSVPVTVAKKEVTVSGITAADKTYDGNTNATLDFTGVNISGKIGSDALTVTATGAFTDKNAGENKTVTISGLTLGGADKDNYVLAAGSQTEARATIRRKEVRVYGIAAEDKTYNGSHVATLNFEDVTFEGIISGDELTVDAMGAFGDANAWPEKTVTISSLTLGGADAGNYKLAAGSQSVTTAAIHPKELDDVSVTFTVDATYNGTAYKPEVTVNSGKTVMGYELALNTDYTVTYGENKNAGTGTVTVTAKAGSNYTFAEKTEIFTIKAKAVSITVDSKTKVFGQADPEFTGTVVGLVAEGDLGTVTYGRKSGSTGENVGDEVVLTASYTANTNYDVTVTDGALTISKASAPALTASAQTLLSSAVVSGSKDYTFDLSKIISDVPTDAGTVTYAVKTAGTKGSSYAVSGNNLTFTVASAQAAGVTDSVVITVSSTNYADADVTVNFEFKNKINVDLGVGSDLLTNADGAYVAEYGTSYVIEGAYDHGNSTSVWTYSYVGTTNAGESYNSSEAPTEAGTYTVTISYEDAIPEGEIPGHVGTVTAELVITRKSVAAVWSNTALIYTGAEQKPTATATGISGALTLSVTGGKTNAGEYEAAAALSAADAANYTLTNATKAYSIAKVVLTPSVDTVTGKTYDGSTDASGTVKLTGAVNSETPVAEAAFAWTSANAGTATVNVTVALTDAAVNKNYELSTTTLSGVSAAGAAIAKKPAAVEWTVGSYTYNGSVQTLPTASFTGVDGTVSCTVTVDGGKEFKNAGEYGFTATEASGNYELSNATTEATVAKAVRTLSFAEDTFRILPGKTVTVVPSFNALDGSGSVVYGTNAKLSNSGNSFTAAGNGTVTITAQVAETANYEASNTVELTFHVIEEFQTEVSNEQKISSNNGTIAAATTKVLGLAEAVAGVEAKAKAIAAKADNVAKVPADYKTYTIEVVFGATIDMLDDKTSATPASMKLDVEPNYTVYAVSEDGTKRTELETVTLSQLTKAVDLQVTLPTGFEPNVARHTKGNGAVEWLAVTVNGNVATWKQDSFSVVELIEDEREATINFVKDNGTTVTETYDIFDLDAAFPADSKSNHRFNDWTLEGIAGTHTELTEALWNAIAGQTITATPNFTKNAKPNSTRYGVELETVGGGKASIDRDSVIAGTTVTVTAEPNEGYKVASVKVENAKTGESIYVKANGNAYSFTMPEAGATVTVTFAKIGDYPFTDVPENKYYYDAVLWAVDNGVTTGKTATTFDPNGACTRAQVVTFLWRAAGCPAPTSYDNPFTDVAEDKYYYEAVLWAVENGITSGKTATTFDPNGACTRAQVVTFLWRTAGEPETDRWNSFEDVAFGKYYHDAVVWAVVEGVTGGKTTTTFDPNGICTRGQIVTFLYRYFA